MPDILLPDRAGGDHAHSGAYERYGNYLRAGALAENMPRNKVGLLSCPLISGTLHLTAIWLEAGMLVSNITFGNVTVVASATNQWHALFDINRLCLASSADDGAAAWGAGLGTKAMVTPYPVTASGLYLAGIMYAASTPPGLLGSGNNTGTSANVAAPSLNGRSTTGQTTPPTPGSFTAGVMGGAVGTPWCDVS